MQSHPTTQTTLQRVTPPAPLRVLCLDGGGLLGLATASFLARTEQRLGARFADRFDVFCGTSTGGILALGLAHGMSAEALVRIYDEMGPKVFPRPSLLARPWRFLASWMWPRYAATPLRELLEQHLGDATLGDVQRRGKFVAITALNLRTGEPYVFKTDHADGLVRDAGIRLVDVALATSAAPTYFPPARVQMPGGSVETLADGGVFANDPTMVAYVEALAYLARAPGDIEMLSLSTPRRPLGRRPGTALSLQNGRLAWGLRIADVFIGATSRVHQLGVFHLQRSEHARLRHFLRVDLTNPHGLQMDDSSHAAREWLRAEGAAQADQRHHDLAPFFHG